VTGGAWFLQYTDSTYEFDFEGRYRELAQIFDTGIADVEVSASGLRVTYRPHCYKRGTRRALSGWHWRMKQHLSLSRCSQEHFFMVYRGNKKVRYSMKAEFASMILPLIQEYYASCRTVSGAIDIDTETGTDAYRPPPPYDTALAS